MPSLTPRVTAEGIYGCLAIAVVCIAWEGTELSELAVEILIYSIALWFFHIYARVAFAGWSDRNWRDIAHWSRQEWPHLQAAMPALVVVLLGWWRGWDPLLSSDIAMWATLTNLLAWQVALLAPQRRSNAALLLTLLLDAAVVAGLLGLRLWIK